MSAIVTTEFISQLIEDTKTSFVGNLYIGLGRSQTWGVGDTPEIPLTTFEYAREARGKLQHVKIVTGVSAAVSRQDWISGIIYEAYDDSDQTSIPYVMNSNYEVFLCTQQGVDNNGVVIPSTEEPTVASILSGLGGSFSDPVAAGENILVTNDTNGSPGYTWRYLFTLSQVAINRFLTLDYMPITTFKSDPQDEDVETQQYQIQQISQDGQILNVKVEDGGAGYSSSPTATVLGNGTGITLQPVLNVINSAIRSVEVRDLGQDYDFASIAIDDTVIPSENATLRPILGPKGGIELDPIKTLKARNIIVTTDFENDENDSLITEIGSGPQSNDFRQVLLIKDPLDYGAATQFDGFTSKGNRALLVGSGGTQMATDSIIEGNLSSAKAVVDYHDDVNGLVYFHQTKETGFGSFQQNEPIGNGSVNLTIVNNSTFIQNPGIDVYSGEVLYINNITPIVRDPNQTEDIKIIITF